eukprot:SAG11_NODE_2920_length_2836_cov_1.899525_3_plen_197_part_00
MSPPPYGCRSNLLGGLHNIILYKLRKLVFSNWLLQITRRGLTVPRRHLKFMRKMGRHALRVMACRSAPIDSARHGMCADADAGKRLAARRYSSPSTTEHHAAAPSGAPTRGSGADGACGVFLSHERFFFCSTQRARTRGAHTHTRPHATRSPAETVGYPDERLWRLNGRLKSPCFRIAYRGFVLCVCRVYAAIPQS